MLGVECERWLLLPNSRKKRNMIKNWSGEIEYIGKAEGLVNRDGG